MPLFTPKRRQTYTFMVLIHAEKVFYGYSIPPVVLMRVDNGLIGVDKTKFIRLVDRRFEIRRQQQPRRLFEVPRHQPPQKQVVIVEGSVFDHEGKPIGGTIIDAWHRASAPGSTSICSRRSPKATAIRAAAGSRPWTSDQAVTRTSSAPGTLRLIGRTERLLGLPVVI